MDAGDRLPEFRMNDENSESFSTSLINGLRHIIYIYDKNKKEDRTISLLSGMYAKLMIHNIPIFVINHESPGSNRSYKLLNGIRIKMLSDTEMLFENTECILLIGPSGKIESIFNYSDDLANRIRMKIKSLQPR